MNITDVEEEGCHCWWNVNRETPTWLRWEEVSHSEERQAKKGQGWAVTLGIYSIFGTVFFLFEENK